MLKNKNLGLIIIVLLFSFIFLYGSLLSKKIEVNENLWTIAIPQNSGLSRVSTILSQNTNVNPVLFKIAMYMTFNQNNIKYGRYDFRYINNMRDLVYTITSSSSMKVKVTIPEGLRMQEIALLFEKTMNLDVEKFIYLCYDEKLINSLNIKENINNLEGFLYPDTYIFLKTYNEKDVIKILIENFKNKFNFVDLGDSGLSKLDREMIAVVVSSINRCYYCQVAHGASVRQLSKNPELGEKLIMNFKIADLNSRERSMLNFASKLTKKSYAISEKDRQKLRNNGFSDSDIWDIASVVGFFNMSNRLASATKMEPNEEYHSMAR